MVRFTSEFRPEVMEKIKRVARQRGISKSRAIAEIVDESVPDSVSASTNPFRAIFGTWKDNPAGPQKAQKLRDSWR